MTATTTILTLGTLAAVPATKVAVQAAADNSLMGWLLGGLVGLAGFIGLVFRRVMDRQDKMHDANVAAAAERERRLQDRADAQLALNETHITTMQGIAANLATLNQRVDDVPRRVADEIERKRP